MIFHEKPLELEAQITRFFSIVQDSSSSMAFAILILPQNSTFIKQNESEWAEDHDSGDRRG